MIGKKGNPPFIPDRFFLSDNFLWLTQAGAGKIFPSPFYNFFPTHKMNKSLQKSLNINVLIIFPIFCL